MGTSLLSSVLPLQVDQELVWRNTWFLARWLQRPPDATSGEQDVRQAQLITELSPWRDWDALGEEEWKPLVGLLPAEAEASHLMHLTSPLTLTQIRTLP